MVDLYFRHPGARIFGVELDARNVKVALQNIKGLGMSILHAAVFHKDGQIEYNSTSSFNAFKIATGEASSSTQIKVQALSVGTILRKFDIRHVDYLKIDIEGAEKDIFLLGDLSWMDDVDQISVELHDTLEAKVLIKLLQDRGFKTEQSLHHWASVIGWRK
jgi:FkbM family methyltransferase